MASQITGNSTIHSADRSGLHKKSKLYIAGPLWGEINRWSTDFPHKGPVMQKLFPCDDVIMVTVYLVHTAPDVIMVTIYLVYTAHDVIMVTVYLVHTAPDVIMVTVYLVHTAPDVIMVTVYLVHAAPDVIMVTVYLVHTAPDVIMVTVYLVHAAPDVIMVTVYLVHAASDVIMVTIYLVHFRTQFCCALFCSGFITISCLIHMIRLPLFFRVASLALEQLCDCPSANEVVLKDMGK